jgi:predicted dehydrogenase
MKTNASRRKFIKTSSAVALPFILPSRVWSADVKPGDTITMGFIGMGRQSRGLLSNFIRQDGIRIVAVCDVDSNRREAAKKTVDDHYKKQQPDVTSDCAAYNRFEEIMERDDIDAVCIATPDHWHAIQTLAALRSGKDVYCEKPLTHNIHEAIEVIKAVEKHGRVLQTGSMQRSMKEFRVACELVQNGVIGDIERVECSFGDPGIPYDLPEEAMEPGLDWDRWVGPAPVSAYNSILSPRGVHNNFPRWRNFREFGGGQVADWGAHHLDIAQWGLGMDGDGPIEAVPPQEQGAVRGAVLKYASGVTVVHQDGFGVHFHGKSGEVKVHRGKFALIKDGKVFSQWTKRADGGSIFGALAKAEREFLADKKVSLYDSKHHIQDFLNAVRNRTKPITNEVVGGGSAICCHLMNQAYYGGESVHWDPKNHRLVKDSKDRAEILTREYRAPWSV